MTPYIEKALHLFGLARRDSGTFQVLVEHPKSPLDAMGFRAQHAQGKVLAGQTLP